MNELADKHERVSRPNARSKTPYLFFLVHVCLLTRSFGVPNRDLAYTFPKNQYFSVFFFFEALGENAFFVGG